MPAHLCRYLARFGTREPAADRATEHLSRECPRGGEGEGRELIFECRHLTWGRIDYKFE